ncbi:MAG TPA: hypothetical protein VMW36_03230 [Patescibacteria group bacterium]|nr:hypothetical protein [Patescibacteria group bacterium]
MANVEDKCKKFWIASHCGNGTEDENEICGFCGLTYGDCARKCTEEIKANNKMVCGGGGHWCPSCGRFWAQNVCGELYDGELMCKDNTEMIVTDDTDDEAGGVFCSCGHFFYEFREEGGV